MNATYLVGSKHESYGETGMAHLLEHLLFKGSTRHPSIPKELQDHGSRPNGSTSYERTNYFETFSATDANLEWALDLESDRMVNAFVSRKDLDSEMTVVRNEFEAGENSPLGVLLQRVLSTAYLWHNYGKAVIGSRADIENVPIDRLQAFYKTHYQPDNAVPHCRWKDRRGQDARAHLEILRTTAAAAADDPDPLHQRADAGR